MLPYITDTFTIIIPSWLNLGLNLILKWLVILWCQCPQVRAKNRPEVAPTNFPLAFCWQTHAMAAASYSVNPYSICLWLISYISVFGSACEEIVDEAHFDIYKLFGILLIFICFYLKSYIYLSQGPSHLPHHHLSSFSFLVFNFLQIPFLLLPFEEKEVEKGFFFAKTPVWKGLIIRFPRWN